MRTVLIADDALHIRLLVTTLLPPDRYRILEAADGHEAWTLIRQHHPDVALLDIQMPGPSGLELTQAIRQDPELAATKVIIVTGQRAESDIAAGLAAGADIYLTKPFSVQKLLAAIDWVLGAA